MSNKVDKELEHILSRPVHELDAYLRNRETEIPEMLLEAIAADPRKAVRRLGEQLRKRRLRNLREQERLRNLLRFESELYREGCELIAGVDEAGVAPLAGPVVAAAVILPRDYAPAGLDDSKKIPDERKRDDLATRIKQDAICWATGFTEVEEIDRMNIYRSSLLAMSRAVEGLSTKPEYILVDARTIPHCPAPQRAIVHGDALSASIAAASIIAKTTRDAYMKDMDRTYPGYGFASHKGYPTPMHLKILKQLGPLPIHRTSFAPVREVLDRDPVQRDLFMPRGDSEVGEK